MTEDVLNNHALNDQLRDDILTHARDMAAMSPPVEAAGVIKNGVYHPMANLARDPRAAFSLPVEVMTDRSVEGIVHSHPGGPAWPSGQDMRSQIDTQMIWHIAVVKTATRPDIREDVFSFGMAPRLDMTAGYRHGVNDCYSLIRGFHHEEWQITLPDVPRDWHWWLDGQDLYENGFHEAGFRRIEDAPKRGDVFLARVRSKVVNHAGIWLGDGLVLHHLGGRDGLNLSKLPQIEPAERWMKFIDGWIRHKDRCEEAA